MLQLVVLLKKNTLPVLNEHTTADALGGAVEINANEVLVALDSDVVGRLLQLARPEDKRLDDVIVRLAT